MRQNLSVIDLGLAFAWFVTISVLLGIKVFTPFSSDHFIQSLNGAIACLAWLPFVVFLTKIAVLAISASHEKLNEAYSSAVLYSIQEWRVEKAEVRTANTLYYLERDGWHTMEITSRYESRCWARLVLSRKGGTEREPARLYLYPGHEDARKVIGLSPGQAVRFEFLTTPLKNIPKNEVSAHLRLKIEKTSQLYSC